LEANEAELKDKNKKIASFEHCCAQLEMQLSDKIKVILKYEIKIPTFLFFYYY
jgi:hypothetical protein